MDSVLYGSEDFRYDYSKALLSIIKPFLKHIPNASWNI